MILWHLLAILLTAMVVLSGFDWFYFQSTRDPLLRVWMFPAAPIGGIVPLALPLILIVSGFILATPESAWPAGTSARRH